MLRHMFKRIRASKRAKQPGGASRENRKRLRLKLEQLEDRTAPAVLTVNTLADNTTADSALSLREAILAVDGTLGRSFTSGEQAQATGTLGTNDTIQFNLPSGPQTITLASTLSITKSVVINGPGLSSLTVNGNNAVRVFAVGQSSANLNLVVTVSGMTISAGSVSGSSSYGGGILNFGALTVNNCAFNNNASAAGGAIANSATLTVSNSTFTGNNGVSDGGAIYNYHSVGTMTITNCAFTHNTSNADGGAIRSNVKLVLSNSTFTGNFASSEGGGLSTSDSQATVSNCTFAGNTAGSKGGGIMIENISSAITLVNNTVTANRVNSTSSGVGGGIRSDFPALLRNNVVAGNFRASGATADDIGVTVDANSSFNLIGTGGSGGLTNGTNNNQVGVSNPKLGPLASNGGPTQTVALLAGSPAIDAGSNAFVTAGETDQRGFARIANGTVDIGAFEVQATTGTFIVAGFPSSLTAGGSGNITVTAKDNSNNTLTNYTGTVHFTSSDPKAILPADYTFVSGDNGVHAFSNVILKTAGNNQSITVTDTANSQMTGTQSGIAVLPAAASTFSVVGFPSPATKGVSGSFTVTARDPFGNTASGYAGTVRFTSSDPLAVLPANSSLAGGVSSFNATLNTVGTQSLTATDSANSAITGSQTGVVVNSSNSSNAVLKVNSTADNTAADSVLTLREAIGVVNGNLGRALTAGEQAQITGVLGNNNTIQFNLPSGPQTITLGGSVLQITKAVTVTGPGATNLTINANNLSRVFLVGQIFTQNLSLVVAMSGLTVTGGSALSGSTNYGAGLLNFGTLTLNNMVFSGNAAGSSGGGGIYNKGALNVSNCMFSGNSVASGSGGAIQNASASTLTVAGSTFSANTGTAGGSGAGIANSGTATVTSSAFTANSAASNGAGVSNSVTGKLTLIGDTFTNGTAASDGGGLDNDGDATVTNCTFSANSASSEGGAVDNHGTMQLSNCTLYGNTAASRGGAINSTLSSPPANSLQLVNCTITANRTTNGSSGHYGGGLYDTTPAKLQNTIVAGNFQGTTGTTANDIYGNVDTASSFNLIGTGGSGGMVNGANNNLVGVSNPGLGVLANNGGPVKTVMLLVGSPARDRGSNAFVTSGQTDQRGYARIVNGTVDIGALEVQITFTPPADQSSSAGVATAFSLGSFLDTNVGASPWSVDVNWGDGSAHTTFTRNTTGALASQSHAFAATGTYTVTATVTDINNDPTMITFRVTVTG